MLTGSLTSGNFIGAKFIGTGGVANAFPFQDFSVAQIDDNTDGLIDGTFDVITATSSGGNARLKLGRADGQSASDPSIYFRSSQVAATNYNVALIASGGNNTDGSGGLEVKVADADQLELMATRSGTLVTSPSTPLTFQALVSFVMLLATLRQEQSLLH